MTIKDIARESGYAVGTVSRVLNNSAGVSEEARKRVMEVVEKHHFRLNNNAKHLKQQVNSGVVIIVKGRKNMLFSSLVEILQDLIKKNGYACLIYYVSEDDDEVDQAIQICRERQPLGILFLGSNKDNFKKGFQNIEIPCVMVTNSAEQLEFENLSSVSIDDMQAAKKAIEHLIALGHKKIGIIGGKMENSNPSKVRYGGCIQAFSENGIDFDAEKQFCSAYFTVEDGYNAMIDLLKKMPDLTAVFTMSDVTALGAIRAAKDHGFNVPEDISVVGFDGIEIGQYMIPKLTTIYQPEKIISEKCVEILLDCVLKNQKAVCLNVPFELLSGESTRKID